MKRLISIFAILLALASTTYAAPPAVITSLNAIHTLTDAVARQSLPVAFEATVTYFNGYKRRLFVEDGNAATFVRTPAGISQTLVPGDRILVHGTTQYSFLPYIMGSSITLLHHGALPNAIPATFDEMARGEHIDHLVTVHGVLRAVNPQLGTDNPLQNTTLQLSTDGGMIDAIVDGNDASYLKSLLDAESEITGAVASERDSKMQMIGLRLHVSSSQNIHVIKLATQSPSALPVTPMGDVFSAFHSQNLTRRVRVHGTITYYEPGSLVILQNGADSIQIVTQSYAPLRIGDLADATGFPEVQDVALVLTNGEIEDSHQLAPIAPAKLSWRQLAVRGETDRNHIFDLVSIEGRVLTEVREASQDEYVVVADGQLLSAYYNHPADSHEVLPPMNAIAPGSRIRVTGICVPDKGNPLGTEAFTTETPFRILMRTPADIVVVAGPPFLSIRNLVIVAGLLLVILVFAGILAWALERKVRRQTAALAARVEAEAAHQRSRSRILEDINGTRPLDEILKEIAELVSAQLDGAPCLCEITGGSQAGIYPKTPHHRRIVRVKIAARSGPPLGIIFAGFPRESQPGPREIDALSGGARLATLAIETRCLYSDLLHRSEFDLLTDMENRFSLDKRIDAQIEEAEKNKAIFGLIYIDLDNFKLVNDQYGHHFGDLYLQEVARRMKNQLRAFDTLARIGGDEFVALALLVNSHADVEEIAQRLIHSFDLPVTIKGHSLQGSASIGFALYPEAGATRDSLLNAADIAMYKVKKSKQQSETTPADAPQPAASTKSVA